MSRARSRFLLLASSALAVALLTTGCGKGAAPSAPIASDGISQQAADDIARQFASSLALQGGLPLDRIGNANLTAMARGEAPALRRSGIAQVQDEGDFSWSFSVTFFDAAGNQQLLYDPETTARAQVQVRARGHVRSAEHEASVGVRRLLDVQGLLPTETTIEIDGTANDTADCAFEARDGSASREYNLLSSGRLVDVRQLKDSNVNPYPLSGTARWAVEVDAREQDASGTREAHFEATVVVTFNGTRHPTIEIDSRYRYSGDLVTGEVSRLPA